jgi:transposase
VTSCAHIYRQNVSYKTLAGARVGDIHISLIHTCALNGINPFDYLMALEQHVQMATNAPSDWFPWNYRQTIEAATRA